MAEIPEDVAAEIRDTCRKLAKDKGLDDGTRDELCDHLEEKVAGYLCGEVKITQADALLLARGHFGDIPEVAEKLAAERGPTLLRWFPWLAGPRFLFAVGLVMVTTVFGIIVPLLAQFGANLQADFEDQWSAAPSFVILISPWGPWLVAAVGVAALCLNKRFLSARAAFWTYAATIVGLGLLGGMLCLILLLPAVGLIVATPN
jgi:hypothetical protein